MVDIVICSTRNLLVNSVGNMNEAMNKELPKLRAALTRAKNSKNNDKIIETCNKAFARFEVIGYPDQWHEWQRAKDDAIFNKRR